MYLMAVMGVSRLAANVWGRNGSLGRSDGLIINVNARNTNAEETYTYHHHPLNSLQLANFHIKFLLFLYKCNKLI